MKDSPYDGPIPHCRRHWGKVQADKKCRAPHVIMVQAHPWKASKTTSSGDCGAMEAHRSGPYQ